jgi:hypothetical protein
MINCYALRNCLRSPPVVAKAIGYGRCKPLEAGALGLRMGLSRPATGFRLLERDVSTPQRAYGNPFKQLLGLERRAIVE